MFNPLIIIIIIVRTRFSPKTQMVGQWPKEHKTMNLLESELEKMSLKR